MENKDLHTRINETLNSLDGIQRATANPFLLTRVMEQMKQPRVERVRTSLIWQLAASFMLIVALNIWVGFYSTGAKKDQRIEQESEYYVNHSYNY